MKSVIFRFPCNRSWLTAIEKRQISRLGSTQAVPIDVRLICATNADIRRMVDEGSFRQDLLYRINTIEIHIPPLRERGNDIILLAEYFLDRYARKYKKTRPIMDGFRKNNVNYWVFREIRSIIPHL